MRCFGLPLAEIAEPVDGPWASRLAQIAHWNDLVIAAGMFTPGDAGRVRNTVRVVGEGIDASYDKIHLFDAFGFTESSTVTPGDEPVVVGAGEPFAFGVGAELEVEDGVAVGGVGAVAVVVPIAGIAVQFDAAAAGFS